MSPKQVSRVKLTPDVVDCIVFWTKNPEPMKNKLDLLKDYNYYFQLTITPYSYKLEKNVPDMIYTVCAAHELATKIGSDKIIWRYDPILLTSVYTVKEHIFEFELLAKSMAGATQKCVISFYDEYKKIQDVVPPTLNQIEMLCGAFAKIAETYEIEFETCSETMDLSRFGIKHGKCIDNELISKVIGQPLTLNKDKGQRQECGCVTSVDIGAYSSCKHGCVYCYAQRADLQLQKHQWNSTMLLGCLQDSDKLTERKMISYKKPTTEMDMFE
jgi:hypothetical protein